MSGNMESTAIITVVKMMEALPQPVQDRVVDLVREYLADLEDEGEWDAQFAVTGPELVAAARHARREIHEDKSDAMDFNRL